MENLFLFAILTTILFCLVKIVEMKYIEKELKPLKYIVRDAVAVFVCSLVASYSYFYMNDSFTDFMNVVTENKTLNLDSTQIFTDVPNF
jgi:hypothetical protein